MIKQERGEKQKGYRLSLHPSIINKFTHSALIGYFDILHLTSYIFKVNCDEVFDLPKFESYELKNGIKTIWIDIDEAIDHNRQVIERLEPSMGLSIKRELFLLETIRQEYLLCEE